MDTEPFCNKYEQIYHLKWLQEMLQGCNGLSPKKMQALFLQTMDLGLPEDTEQADLPVSREGLTCQGTAYCRERHCKRRISPRDRHRHSLVYFKSHNTSVLNTAFFLNGQSVTGSHRYCFQDVQHHCSMWSLSSGCSSPPDQSWKAVLFHTKTGGDLQSEVKGNVYCEKQEKIKSGFVASRAPSSQLTQTQLRIFSTDAEVGLIWESKFGDYGHISQWYSTPSFTLCFLSLLFWGVEGDLLIKSSKRSNNHKVSSLYTWHQTATRA